MVSSRTSSVNVTVNGNAAVVADGGAGNASREDEGRAANGVIGPREWNQSGPPSLSMSVDLHNLVSSTLTDSGRFSTSPDDHQATSDSTANAIKIGCHDEEESYEGFGSVEGDLVDDGPESPGGSSSAPSPTGTNSHRNPRSPNSTVGRHSWLRTSLRRTPPCSARKRLSTNALASQLYRSGSFNSSGMGSNYDATDDVYSDVSLEDVMDLSHKEQPHLYCIEDARYPPESQNIVVGALPMCATRSRQSYGSAHRDSDRDHHPHPAAPHPVPYSYYLPPPSYSRCPPYDPHAAYHCPSSFYPTPYCTHYDQVTKEEPSVWSWSTVVLLTLLVIGLIVIVYRSFSRETRRKIIAWLRSPRLTPQVQMIQEQMDALADTKSVGEERYARAKQENATLQARILMLEEAAKDAETRAEERLQTEQRRHREWAGRLERERQLQLENYAIKLQAAEVDSSSLREEIARVREQLERARADKMRLENDLREVRREADAARESERHAMSRANEAHHMLDAMREELSLRSEDQQRIEELVQQVAQLQARNKNLEESRDELQAAAALQAGRELLMLNPCNNNAEKGPSLAAELLAGMNPDQIDGQGELNELCTMAELKQALKEQQEVNTQLRTYIDGILLNIVENYPQLLEVKQTH